MAVNWPVVVYGPNYDFFARDITVTPLASQPMAPAYTARGIYDTRVVEIPAADGSIVSDLQTIVDVREMEFGPVPQQRDQVSIPAFEDLPDEGTFEVTDAFTNGGGETTLVLRRIKAPDMIGVSPVG